jgi:hypothetical protein
VSTGFGDSNAYLRELTLKSMLVLAPKLSAKTLNQSLLKFLAKLQARALLHGPLPLPCTLPQELLCTQHELPVDNFPPTPCPQVSCTPCPWGHSCSVKFTSQKLLDGPWNSLLSAGLQAPLVEAASGCKHGLQVDEEPGIRANTTILLGNLAGHLSEAACKRVLLNAFTRALRDAFPPARIAGVKAMLATAARHSPEEIALRALPALAPLAVDPAGEVCTSLP